MKIIALTPIRNESWILPTYLSSIKKITDEIIVFNDNSTDNSKKILNNNGVKIITNNFIDEKYVNMSKRRDILLFEGRKASGTHFIWLDADETFSANFITKAKNYIQKLKPGEKIWIRWIHLWKSIDKYVSGNSSFANIYKDFIVCDDGQMSFPDQFLSEPRTPGLNDKIIKISENDGVVLHFQFVAWQQMQLKQAWYRCNEYIKRSRNAKKINNIYAITLNESKTKLSRVPIEWIENIILPINIPTTSWHLEIILSWFDEYDIKFFEPLQIWHIQELHNEFIKRVGREPKVQTYPKWLVKANNIKNKIKNLNI